MEAGTGASGICVHVHVRTSRLGCFGGEEWAGSPAEERREHCAGNLRDLGVVPVHLVVVEIARIRLNPFDTIDIVMKGCYVRLRLQFGIAIYHR